MITVIAHTTAREAIRNRSFLPNRKNKTKLGVVLALRDHGSAYW